MTRSERSLQTDERCLGTGTSISSPVICSDCHGSVPVGWKADLWATSQLTSCVVAVAEDCREPCRVQTAPSRLSRMFAQEKPKVPDRQGNDSHHRGGQAQETGGGSSSRRPLSPKSQPAALCVAWVRWSPHSMCSSVDETRATHPWHSPTLFLTHTRRHRLRQRHADTDTGSD